MKTYWSRARSGNGTMPHPLWMRLVSVFCMFVLGVASTVQVCHSHDESGSPAFFSTLHAGTHLAVKAASPSDADPITPSVATVNCPLCVAMHSALPATHRLERIVELRIQAPSAFAATPSRLFLWRFELASRPPPAPLASRSWRQSPLGT